MVWRRQMRGRNPRWDVIWAMATIGALLAATWGLQAFWLQGGTVGGHEQALQRRWLIAYGAGAALLLPLLATFPGAASVPLSAEVGAIQAELLTRLRPFEIVLGRLLAAQWPILPAMALSCSIWLIAQSLRPVAESAGQILLLHLVLLSAVYMVGAVAALGATRRVPGCARERGVSVALLWLTLCATAILWADPQVRRMDDPVRLIEATLLVNPVAAATTTLQLDLLRTRLLYDRSAASEFEFAYPSPMATVGLFVGFGLVAQGLTALRLRHAFARG